MNTLIALNVPPAWRARRASRARLQFIRLAAFAVALASLMAAVASAQPPKDGQKDPPKDPPKEKESADEQKAREAFQAGKLDEAVKALQAAVKTNPSLSPAKVIVSRWCLETQQGQQARILLEQAAMDDPGHPEVLLTNGSYAHAEGRITDLILSCQAALAAADSPRWDAEQRKRFQREARTGLAAGFESRADFASVKAQLLAMLQSDANNATLRQRLARANFLLNQTEEAYAELKTAYKDDSTLDPPELTMAQLWTQKPDFVKSDEWYAKAVSAHGKSAKVHREFAVYLLNRGRIDLAKAHLGEAKKIEPKARDTKAIDGLFCRYNKDYAGATAIFEELVREHPAFSFATANLALVLAENGNTDDKRRSVELADTHARQNPRSGDARALVAYCLFKSGRTADAEKVAQSAFGLGGNISPDSAYFLAKVLTDRGSIENAHKIIKATLENKELFVYRKDAEALLAELDKKMPKK